MSAYYNEIEPYAAQWLRNLIAKGLIADGEVDTRSIVDVSPDELRGYTQCHFFAGIGGWSHALRLAGWPDDRPVWTGSCPCQPFSVAGKGAGTDDPRHLWPHFHRLISAVRPPVVLGEQVAGAAGYGWLDGVRADLEREGYASRGADLPALAVNAPHIRQRLYWVALDMADAHQGGRGRRPHDGDGERDGQAGERHEDHGVAAGGGEDRLNVADAKHLGLDGRTVQRSMGKSTEEGRMFQSEGLRSAPSFWDDHIWLTGSDEKSRRSQPGLPLLAYGVSGGISLVRARKDGAEETHTYNRVGALRAFGNAIVAPLAKEVIIALMEVLDDGKQSLQENR